MNEGPLRRKSFLLAKEIVELYKFLSNEKKEFVLSKQMLRSGTNPGAMIREAINAESKADFIHKLKIAQKEASETQYWLELLLASDYINADQFNSINNLTIEILKMTTSSILTIKKKSTNH